MGTDKHVIAEDGVHAVVWAMQNITSTQHHPAHKGCILPNFCAGTDDNAHWVLQQKPSADASAGINIGSVQKVIHPAYAPPQDRRQSVCPRGNPMQERRSEWWMEERRLDNVKTRTLLVGTPLEILPDYGEELTHAHKKSAPDGPHRGVNAGGLRLPIPRSR